MELINKRNIKMLFDGFGKYVRNNKLTIRNLFFAVIFLSLASFLLETYAFENNLNAKNRQVKDNIIFVADQSNLQNLDKAENNQSWKLTIKNDGKFINNLVVNFNENPNDFFVVKYKNLKGDYITKENRTQKNILRSENNFLKEFWIKINDNPSEIIFEFPNESTKVSSITINNDHIFNYYRFILMFLFGLLLFLLLYFRNLIYKRIEVGFLMTSVICGLLLVSVQPKSYISWDDFIHYKNADSLTLNKTIKKDAVDIYSKTNSVPHSYSIKEQEKIDEYFDNNVKKGDFSKKKKSFDFSLKEAYNKLGYLPAAFALMLGRLLNLPPHIIFMLGRFANVLTYSVIVYFAIKKLQSGKMILAVVALFPTSIFLASNYSYDYWVTAFTMLGLSYLFNSLQNPKEKILKKDLLIILGSLFIGLGPKPIYFPLVALLFFLRSTKLRDKKEYKKFLFATTLLILIIVGSFVLPFLISGEGGGDTRGGSQVNSLEQVNFILTQPFAYTKILTNFMVNYINPLNWKGLVTSFAYLGEMNGLWIILIILLIVSLFDKEICDKETTTLKLKFAVILIFLATTSLICTALYVAFTAVGRDTIAGVQPRYMTPLVFPLFFVIGNSKIKFHIKNKYISILIFASIASVFFWGTWNIIVKNYF